jgi:DNA-binding transcriptional MerR regulator
VGSLRISELAQRAEVPVSTVRYYERIGLMPSPARSPNGYRVYDESAVEHLAFISRAKTMGVPLEQVSELIALWSTGGCRSLQDRIRSFLVEKIGALRSQKLELTEFEQQLAELLGRLGGVVGSPGLCDLDYECVHLETDREAIACARFPTVSQGRVTCTLEQEDQVARVVEWQELVSLGAVEATRGGLRILFAPSDGLAERVARLSAAEAGCCSFFGFRIDVSARALVLEVAIPDDDEARRLAAALFGATPAMATP